MKPKEIQLKGETHEVKPWNASLEEGVLTVDEIIFKDETLQIPEVSWEDFNPESIKPILFHILEQSRYNINTCSNDYDEPKFISADTIQTKVLKLVYDLAPTTSGQVDDHADFLDHPSSPYISDLKELNLIACVGHHSKSNIVVPTHLGVKELYCVYGTPDIEDDSKLLD